MVSFMFISPIHFPAFLSGMLALGIYEGAYITEIIRAGIQSIEKGQWEAADALGLSRWQRMRLIVLPQAIQRILPPMAGQFISTIKDSAIVAAAALSHRYIADRFLPNKAIDLIDECASKLRIEIDSMPAEIDEIQRKMTQLEIEKEALKKESDKASKERLSRLDADLSGLNDDLLQMKAHWQNEKDAIQAIREIKEKQEHLGVEAQKFETEGNLAKVAEIRYGQSAELEKQLEQARQTLSALQENKKMLKEEVEEDDIAEVISRWTGIPVNKMLEGERDKLLRMEHVLHERVVGQNEAVDAVADAIRRLIHAIGGKKKKRYVLEIIEDR